MLSKTLYHLIIVLVPLIVLISFVSGRAIARRGELCSVCQCTDIDVFCEQLKDPNILRTYCGPPVMSLIVTNSSLFNLRKEHLEMFTDVRTLTLENVEGNIRSFELALMRKMVNLNLESNLLTGIKSKMFISNDQLENMYLGKNQINFIANGAFDGLSKLSKLKLESNKLTRLEAGNFIGLAMLKELDLSFNELETINAEVFLPLRNLERIHLRSNLIWSLAPAAVALLAARPSLSLNVAKNRVQCTCGDSHDAWLVARGAGLLHSHSGLQELLCSSGDKSWFDAMELLTCSTTTTSTSSSAIMSSHLIKRPDNTSSESTSRDISKPDTSSPAASTVTVLDEETVTEYKLTSLPQLESDSAPTSAPSEQRMYVESRDISSGNMPLFDALSSHSSGFQNKYVNSEVYENSAPSDQGINNNEEGNSRGKRSHINGSFKDIGDPNNETLQTSGTDNFETNRLIEIILVLVVSQVAILATITGATYYLKYTHMARTRQQSLSERPLISPDREQFPSSVNVDISLYQEQAQNRVR